MSHRLTLVIAALGGAFVLAIAGYIIFIAIDAAPGDAFFNPTKAMEPTLLVGDRFTVRNIDGARGTAIRRGELVMHAWPVDRSKRFVKRIVGLPDDTLEMVGGRLRVNGKEVPEPYAWHEESTVDPASDEFHWQRAHLAGPAAQDSARYSPSRNNWGPILVPPRMYFVLGDNRDNSLDSRYWGFLPGEDILGEARRVYFSRDSTGHIRWSRFGRRVR